MKTAIDLTQFSFVTRRLYKQISDDPNTGFIRVIVSERNEICDDIETIFLKAKTYYINPATQQIVPQMTHETMSKGAQWLVSNGYRVVLVDGAGTPIDNPGYDTSMEVSEENFPYLKQPAYDRFASFLYSETNPVSLPFIWKLNIDLDDSKGYFDIKESYD